MSISLKRIKALTKKELKGLVKNQNVLIMSLLPLFFGILYNNLYSSSNFMDKILILIMCVNMNLTLCGSFIIAMLIAEEKEKNTLRTLLLSGVSALEFLIGKIVITLLLTQLSNLVLFFIIGFDMKSLGWYLLYTFFVSISMIILGSLIGLIAPTQMSTGVIGMPILFLLLIIPMFADFNVTFQKIAAFTPNYNMNLLITNLIQSGSVSIDKLRSVVTILVWIVLSIVAFLVTYKKVGIDK
ncbi:MAG: putative transporter rane component protein [Anaerocolumna sp.]|jgi:ABC-2 type transport system permease protein|nr:putative transporter rane component protein [Anaerocolumna sp.]